jgi:hypothetical protein
VIAINQDRDRMEIVVITVKNERQKNKMEEELEK